MFRVALMVLSVVACVYFGGCLSSASDLGVGGTLGQHPQIVPVNGVNGGDVSWPNSVPVVRPSKLIARIRAKMNESKGISGNQLTDYANKLLKTDGYDFTFNWEPKGKINQAMLEKADGEFHPYSYAFTTEKGKRLDVELMNDEFRHPCTSVIDIPVTNVSRRKLTMVSNVGRLTLAIPKDFQHETMSLVDRSKSRVIRTWNTPIDALPVGISADGRKLYFGNWEFEQDRSNGFAKQPIGLAIELAIDGTLRFVNMRDVPSDHGVYAENKKNTEIGYKKYKVKGKEYFISFTWPCT